MDEFCILNTEDRVNEINKIYRLIITCECGCGGVPSLGRRFLKGHYFKGKKRTKTSSENNYQWVLRETRYCECPCRGSFECKINSKQRFISGHNFKGVKRPEMSKRITGKGNPNYGKDMSGENNGMYGIHRYGKDNSNYGNHKFAGKNSSWYGGHHTEETKEKQRMAKVGKHPSPETIEKLRKASLNCKINYHPKTTEPIVSAYLDEIGEEHKDQKNIENITRVDHFLPRIKGIIQDDGCFVHGCVVDKPNSLKYERIRNNIQRDEIQDKKLKALGYKILRIWEHDIGNGNYKQIINDFIKNQVVMSYDIKS